MNILTDHTGKPSSNRAVSIMATVTFCLVIISQTVGYGKSIDVELMWILAGMAVAPQALKGWFENKTKVTE